MAAPPNSLLHSSEPDEKLESLDSEPATRDWRFWCIIFSLAICMLLTAIEFTAVGTALPVIVQDLKADHFVWVGSAYTLGCTALIPFCGGLAHIFGRRAIMLAAITLFCIGSALCGAARNMNVLIAGRTIQGLGGGAITALNQIILADLVPLQERGSFNGVMALAWGIGGGSGPVIGGSLAQRGQWRWLFYLNLPICGVAAILVTVFLKLKIPNIPLTEKVKRLDCFGNLLVVASTTSVVIALTWAGIQFAWTSAKVLVPLTLGLLGMGAFWCFLDLRSFRPEISNRAAKPFFLFLLNSLQDWLSVYFQACRDAGPTAAGVDGFGLSYTISPSCLLSGLVVQKTLRYRQPLWVGWMLMTIGCALLATLDENSGRSLCYGFQALIGVGLGIIYVVTYFPVLAPIPVSQSGPALAFFTFLRNLALIWGVTIGGTVLQNQLTSRLPADFLAKFPGGTQIAFEVIPTIRQLPQPLKAEVRHAFAKSLQVLWNVLAGISGLGLVVSLSMKHLPLHTSVDTEWGRKQQEGAKDLSAS